MQEYIKKLLGSEMTTLIISNKDVDDIRKIVKSLKVNKSLEDLLIKYVSETIKMKQKNKRSGVDRYIRS